MFLSVKTAGGREVCSQRRMIKGERPTEAHGNETYQREPLPKPPSPPRWKSIRVGEKHPYPPSRTQCQARPTNTERMNDTSQNAGLFCRPSCPRDFSSSCEYQTSGFCFVCSTLVFNSFLINEPPRTHKTLSRDCWLPRTSAHSSSPAFDLLLPRLTCLDQQSLQQQKVLHNGVPPTAAGSRLIAKPSELH